jgi:hypothetical protein
MTDPHSSACVQVTPILINNVPEHKSSDAGNSDMPNRSHEMLPLGKKVKVLKKEGKIIIC